MDLTKHCQLCDHQKVDFKTGTYCGLTNRKPEFHIKCVNAKFDSKLENEISNINIDYEGILKIKWRSYINFIAFSILGTLLILAGCYIGLFLFKNWNYGHKYDRYLGSASVVLIFGSILFVFPIATKYLSHYINNFKLTKAKKQNLDKVLGLYNIKYNINISFPKKSSDDDYIEVDLKIKK
ncbi:hypothetical protein H8K90_11760 [Winogradskyella echinorum]|uniref:Uncharacterized protein n=1 Tax=Winogradskyella echinorum TaxID=538189 RepID=A0ABR6Y2T1_9FLAO|nr:hypothetical protein [Winogradskyella echinorum]MBC3847060.1 hypothetical protein [Winogradskyella echinorum]MBC5751408.1 hypothetical protein [Winogradskyella echinorum]